MHRRFSRRLLRVRAKTMENEAGAPSSHHSGKTHRREQALGGVREPEGHTACARVGASVDNEAVNYPFFIIEGPQDNLARNRRTRFGPSRRSVRGRRPDRSPPDTCAGHRNRNRSRTCQDPADSRLRSNGGPSCCSRPSPSPRPDRRRTCRTSFRHSRSPSRTSVKARKKQEFETLRGVDVASSIVGKENEYGEAMGAFGLSRILH